MEFTVNIDHHGFKGKATLNFPTKAEKSKLLEEVSSLGFGEGREEVQSKTANEKMKLMTRMGEIIEERLISIDVVHTESGTVINDKAMLDIYAEGQLLSGVMTNFILVGVKLGNSKNSTSEEP